MQCISGRLSAPYVTVQLDGEDPVQCFSMKLLHMFVAVSGEHRRINADEAELILEAGHLANLPENMTNNDVVVGLARAAVLQSKKNEGKEGPEKPVLA